MASLTPPPLLKKIVPYLKRAEELDKDVSHPESKVVAYYCRAYAMTMGMELRGKDSSKEVMGFLMALMDKLEADKKGLPENGQRLVADFANKVFTKADEEDQLGVADKSTARTYYAAGNFYDIMDQFANKDPEIEKRRKYAKWKANEILTAIKEGRAPTPGGYGEAQSSTSPVPGEDGGLTAQGGGGGASVPPPQASPLNPPGGFDIPQAPSASPAYPPSPTDNIASTPVDPPPPYSAIASPPGYPNPLGGGGGGSSLPPPQPAQKPPPQQQPPAVSKQPTPPPPASKQPSGPLPRTGSANLTGAFADSREYAYAAISAMLLKDKAKAMQMLDKAMAALRNA